MARSSGITMYNVGIVLGALGGIGAVIESSMVLAFTSGSVGWVGLVVAALAVVGTVVIVKGRRLFGALVMFFSTLIGQLTGGAIGLTLAVLIAPPPPPFFNFGFLVSSWTFYSLLGSILVLFTLWKNKRQKRMNKKNVTETSLKNYRCSTAALMSSAIIFLLDFSIK